MVKKEKKSPRGDKRRKDAPALIAELFRSLPDKRYSVKSLMAAVGATTRDEKERVRGIVRDLAAEGVIEQVSEGKYRLSHSERETVEGTVDMTSSGALYVIVEGMDKDIYVNASRTSHALHGDRVRVAITRKGRTGNPEGEVVEIVERSKKNYVGVVEMSEGDAFAFVRVDSRKMATDIFVPARALHGAKGGEKVLVKITGWPDTMRSPEGEIVDVFGEPGDNNAEMHAILAEFDLPYGYPEEVEKEAEEIPETITDEEIAARRDMRGVATFTIDPADAKDFDDALSIRRLENGNYEVGVHIADVTHYVHPGDLIDTEGQNRATSVYLVDRTIPMLPERLSNRALLAAASRREAVLLGRVRARRAGAGARRVVRPHGDLFRSPLHVSGGSGGDRNRSGRFRRRDTETERGWPRRCARSVSATDRSASNARRPSSIWTRTASRCGSISRR